MDILRSKDTAGSTGDDSTFIVVRSGPGRFYLSRTGEGKILYHERGSISLNIEKKGDLEIATGRMVFIPPSSNFSIYIREGSCFYLCRLSIKRHFTESSLPLSLLYESFGGCGGDAAPHQLAAHETIAAFFNTVAGYLGDSITAHLFYTQKARELLILMRNYFSAGELARFFAPIVERDHEFSDFVMENYRRYRTVEELASASCHSLSSFNRLFRKNFGCAPYTWIRRQRAHDIYHDLTVTNKPIKELSADHGFSSLSQFTNFCKRQFGISPRTLRRLHGIPAGAEGSN